MDNDRAQLSSVATALDELTARVLQLADELKHGADDQASTELYEVERTLRQAARRLDRLVRGA
jgi:methyl-accepting chemotaxis protein